MTGNNSNCAANSTISDFILLKAFSVKINYGIAPKIKEVIWQPLVFNWIKWNIDGASIGNPGPSSCGGIFRNNNVEFLGAFAYNLGNTNSLVAELNGAIGNPGTTSMSFFVTHIYREDNYCADL